MKLVTDALAAISAAAAAAAPATDASTTVHLCQSGCNVASVACYAAAGATFGSVVMAVAAKPIILACNAALGNCTAACVATAAAHVVIDI